MKHLTSMEGRKQLLPGQYPVGAWWPAAMPMTDKLHMMKQMEQDNNNRLVAAGLKKAVKGSAAD